MRQLQGPQKGINCNSSEVYSARPNPRVQTSKRRSGQEYNKRVGVRGVVDRYHISTHCRVLVQGGSKRNTKVRIPSANINHVMDEEGGR